MERKNTCSGMIDAILNFEVKQRDGLNIIWRPALKLRAPLHPNWTKLWHRRWICLSKCIVAGLFQLILQIPESGFQTQFYSLFLLNCLSSNYFTYHTRCKFQTEKNFINTISFFIASRSTFHYFLWLKGCCLIIQTLKIESLSLPYFY